MSTRAIQGMLRLTLIGLLSLLYIGCDRSPAHTTRDGSPSGLAGESSSSVASVEPSVGDDDDTAPIGRQTIPADNPSATGTIPVRPAENLAPRGAPPAQPGRDLVAPRAPPVANLPVREASLAPSGMTPAAQP